MAKQGKTWPLGFKKIQSNKIDNFMVSDKDTKEIGYIDRNELVNSIEITGELIDPIAPGTAQAPAVIPAGPAGQKRKFTPAPGFYQGFPEVTADKRWEFYWDGTIWQLRDLGLLPSTALGPGGAASYESVDKISAQIPLNTITNFPIVIFGGDWRRTEPIPITKGERVSVRVYGGGGVAKPFRIQTSEGERTPLAFGDNEVTPLEATYVSEYDGLLTAETRVANGDTDYYVQLGFDKIVGLTQFRDAHRVITASSDIAPAPLVWEDGVFDYIANDTAVDMGDSSAKRTQKFKRPYDGAITVSGVLGYAYGIVGFAANGSPNFFRDINAFLGTENFQVIAAAVFLPPEVATFRMSVLKREGAIEEVLMPVEGEQVFMSSQELYNLIQAGGQGGTNTAQTLMAVSRPTFATVDFLGVLPTDEGPQRIPTTLSFKMYDQNGHLMLDGECTLAIQGNGSVQYVKKGYTFEPKNANGEALEIKFGNMVATDSFHMKAYASDRTQSRCVTGGRVFIDMMRKLEYPKNQINNKAFELKKTGRLADLYPFDAQYYTDGFVFRANLNGQFLGLYTMRLKKKRENYALNNRDDNHVFIDSSTYTAYLRAAFRPSDWDVKSPRMTGYEEAGVIPNPAVQTSIERLFNFTRNLNTMYAQHADYIVLDNWLLYYIFCELIGQWDIDGNNYNIMTWDNTHWSIFPYDMDMTLGLHGHIGYNIVTSYNGWVVGNRDIWPTFRTRYLPELRAMYTRMRRNGFIDTENISHYYYDQVAATPPLFFEMDAAKWPLAWNNGEPTMQQLVIFLQSRIEWLDERWLIID